MTTTPKFPNLKEKRDSIIEMWRQRFPNLYNDLKLPTRFKAATVVVQNTVPSLINLHDDSHLDIANRYLQEIYNDLVNAEHTEIDPCTVFGKICELKEFIEAAHEIVDQFLCKRYPEEMRKPSEFYAYFDTLESRRLS